MRLFLKNKLSSLKEELQSYTAQERSFAIFAMLCSFFICCEYSIIRPISNSLFIEHFSARLLPYVWIATVPFNFIAVSLYNRWVAKWGSKLLFARFIVFVVTVNVLFAFFYQKAPFLVFGFYIWKEIYILMIFQLLWSVIHSNISTDKAKYLYGIFFGIGGIGSIVGSSFPGFFAIAYGSENLIFLTLPVYALLFLSYWKMSSFALEKTSSIIEEGKGGFFHGIQLIKKSRFLIFALLIVMFMQMTSAIFDFQYHDFLEKVFSQKDERTQYSARLFGIINSLTVIFQFVGTYALIQTLGFRRAHYLIPFLLGTSALLFGLFPFFSIISSTFVTCKFLDFSVFGVIKEMVYVPLRPDEKFRAKAIIDVFTYRSSKALASLLIICITTFHLPQLLTMINILAAVLWGISVRYGLYNYQKLIKQKEG